jgi:hypothetical protein
MLDQETLANESTSMLAQSRKLTGETFSVLINLSGRRRFTSQRVVLYSVLASHGHEHAVRTALDALALFRDAHDALVDGNEELPGVFCDELKDAYFGSLQGDKLIREFVRLAEDTLAAINTGKREAPALLARLIEISTPLLNVLNKITQVYEELSKGHALQMKKHLRSVMTDIESIAKQARMVSFNAQIVAARAGQAGREFAVVAGVLSNITAEIDELVHEAMGSSMV